MNEPGNLNYIPGRFTDSDGVKRSVYPPGTRYSLIGIRHGDFKIDVLTVPKDVAPDPTVRSLYLDTIERNYSPQVRLASESVTTIRKCYFYQFDSGYAMSFGTFDPYELSNGISPLDYRVAAHRMKQWIFDCQAGYTKYGEMGGHGRSNTIRDLQAKGWDIIFAPESEVTLENYPASEYSLTKGIPVDGPRSNPHTLAIPLRTFGYFFDNVSLYSPINPYLPARPTPFARKYMVGLVGSNWAYAGASSVDYSSQRASYRSRTAALISRLQSLGLTVGYPVASASPDEKLDFGVVTVDEMSNLVQNVSSLRSVLFKFNSMDDLSLDTIQFSAAATDEVEDVLRLKLNITEMFGITMLKVVSDKMTDPPSELKNYVTQNPDATVYSTSWSERFIPLGERVLEDTKFFKKAVANGVDVYGAQLVAGKTFKQAANVANAYPDKTKLLNVIYPSATDFGNSVLTAEVVSQILWTQNGSSLTGTYLGKTYAFDAADEDQRPNVDFIMLYGTQFTWTSEGQFFLAYFESSTYEGYKAKLSEALLGPVSEADTNFSLYGLYRSPFVTTEVARSDSDKFKRWFFIASNACAEDLNQLFLQQVNLYGLK